MEKYVGKIKEILKSKVLKNGIWLIILQIVNTIIPVITIPYITRILGASEYGVFSIALNWILYLQVLVEFGFGLNGARKVAMLKENNKKELNKIYNDIISSRIVLLIISFVVINIIALVSNKSIYRNASTFYNDNWDNISINLVISRKTRYEIYNNY